VLRLPVRGSLGVTPRHHSRRCDHVLITIPKKVVRLPEVDHFLSIDLLQNLYSLCYDTNLIIYNAAHIHAICRYACVHTVFGRRVGAVNGFTLMVLIITPPIGLN
jgi:hypothetical protein